jgi:hypothetical protein
MNAVRDEKLQCNQCGGPTWHALRTSYTANGTEILDDYNSEPWTDCFDVFQCKGCDSVLVRRSFDFFPTGNEVSYFPAPISRHQPQWSWGLPDELRSLLREVYSALHANSSRLALMGIRAVIDVVILEKVGDVGSFAEKLAALQSKGFVGERQRDFLNAVLAAGGAAAHRGHAADAQELGYAMDIVENLLQAVYALEGAAEHLREKTPPRQRPSGGGTGGDKR